MFSDLHNTPLLLTLDSKIKYDGIHMPCHVYNDLTLLSDSKSGCVMYKNGTHLYSHTGVKDFVCAYEKYVVLSDGTGFFKYSIQNDEFKLVNKGAYHDGKIKYMFSDFEVNVKRTKYRIFTPSGVCLSTIPNQSDMYALSYVLPVNQHETLGLIYNRRLFLYDHAENKTRLLASLGSKCLKFDYLPELHSLVTLQSKTHWNDLLFWDDRNLKNPIRHVEDVAKFHGFVDDQACYQLKHSLDLIVGDQTIPSPLLPEQWDTQIFTITSHVFYRSNWDGHVLQYKISRCFLK